MSAGKQFCDCGCRQEEWFNKLKLIEIETAIDESLRRTSVAKRFMVRAECYEPFIRELQAMKLLNDYVRRHSASPWWRRLWYVRRIVRLQHLVNLRNKGLIATRRLSLRSGILFGAPAYIPILPRISLLNWRGLRIPVQGSLDMYWRWRDQKHGRKTQISVVEPQG